MARSGSNYLLELIESTGEFRKFGEIFRNSGDSHSELASFLEQSDSEIRESSRSSKAELLSSLLQASVMKQCPFAAKLFYYHARPDDELWKLLPKVRVLHLIRLNSLAVFVSRVLAERSGIWKAYGGDSCYDSSKIKVDRNEFIRWKAWRDSLISSARARISGLDSLEIYYEDLTDEHRASLEVRQAVGLNPDLERVLVKRQRSRSLREIVSNYNELEEFDVMKPHYPE